ncbi:MAG TPA: ribosomal protein L7/L12, partial [Thermoanaerobaculia bacterium]|nr:ribosomal protein L7/L12 [Thermoanaerobaculia bacterium]
FNGVTGIFETDKGDDFIVGHGLFRAAGQPVSAVRYVDLYLNNLGVIKEGVSKDEAASIKKKFEDAGAKVEVK